MVRETQRNRLRVFCTLPHPLPVSWVMDLGRGAAAFPRIRKDHDAAEGGDAGKVLAIGGVHPQILRGDVIAVNPRPSLRDS